MVPNLINAIIGIWLVYLAVLNPALIGEGRKVVYIAGIGVLVLGVWARGSDYVKWYSSTNIVLGVILLLTAGLQFILWSEAITFWMVFWIGMTVAIISLWAVLYRPNPADLPQDQLAT